MMGYLEYQLDCQRKAAEQDYKFRLQQQHNETFSSNLSAIIAYNLFVTDNLVLGLLFSTSVPQSKSPDTPATA